MAERAEAGVEAMVMEEVTRGAAEVIMDMKNMKAVTKGTKKKARRKDTTAAAAVEAMEIMMAAMVEKANRTAMVVEKANRTAMVDMVVMEEAAKDMAMRNTVMADMAKGEAEVMDTARGVVVAMGKEEEATENAALAMKTTGMEEVATLDTVTMDMVVAKVEDTVDTATTTNSFYQLIATFLLARRLQALIPGEHLNYYLKFNSV